MKYKINESIKKILLFLRGKKTIIATILWALVTLAYTKNIIDQDVMNTLSIILTALGLGVGVASNKLIK